MDPTLAPLAAVAAVAAAGGGPGLAVAGVAEGATVAGLGSGLTLESQSVGDVLKLLAPEMQDKIRHTLISCLEEHDSASRIERVAKESARKQFFKAIYDRDYDLVSLLLGGSRSKYIDANLVCTEDRWPALHACLYKYNQYPPDDTIRIVRLLLEHAADVWKPCPEGAVAINVLDKKPLANGTQNGPDNPKREKKTVSFQNKMVLDVAIDFLQAYKWAGCRQTVLQNWKPLITLLDDASLKQRKAHDAKFDAKYSISPPKTVAMDARFGAKFLRMLDGGIGSDCSISCSYCSTKGTAESGAGIDDDDVDMEDGSEIVTMKTHRVVLMASSRVFEHMFQHEMVEALSSEVKIGETPPDAIKVMLHFMYTGSLLEEPIDKNTGLALSVLCLAEKYDCPDLKEHLEYFLHSRICKGNALEVLTAAHTHNADDLQRVALSFVCDHFHELSKDAAFSDFGKQYPSLLQRVLEIVTKECMRAPRPRLSVV